jgi:hypothetical protein
MQRFNAKDYAANPAPYRAATRAVFNTSIFTHNGEADIQAGTPTALEYAGDALNKLYRRTEPLYRTPDGRTFYGNVFADLT